MWQNKSDLAPQELELDMEVDLYALFKNEEHMAKLVLNPEQFFKSHRNTTRDPISP